MSGIEGEAAPRASTDEPDSATDERELRARLAVLQEENQRLRREYARARRSEYRRVAAGFALAGLVTLGGAVLFPAVRTVLVALGGTGVFVALITYYLTPERFVAAEVGERIYGQFATNGDAIVADLDLSDERVYVPRHEGDDTVRLFVPQYEAYELPTDEALDRIFVTADDDRARGISFHPTGQGLLSEFDKATGDDLRTDPEALADQLADSLVEQFEIVDSARVDPPKDASVTVGISGSVYGSIDRFDHPVVSFLAAGLARGLSQPVTVAVTEGDDRVDYAATFTLLDREGSN